MAKKTKTFIPLNQMSRKDKIIHFLKIFGFSFAGLMAVLAGIVLYVWASGGFNPPFEPLSSWAFSQAEYVIDGNKIIDLDQDGNQKFDDNGNLIYVNQLDEEQNTIYESVLIVPNEGCTELDAEVSISFSSNPSCPIIQLVEDDNVVALDKEEGEEEGAYHLRYSVKINSPIYVKPVTTEIDGKQINLGGWAMLTATQGLLQTSCWVFVDVPADAIELTLQNANNFTSQAEQADEDQVEYYNVYPNSQIKISSLLLPVSSNILPKSNVPQTKGTTEFKNSKVVYYEVSNTEIAQISKDGVITISPGKEGQTFSISAYAISQYNNLQKMPSLQDFVNDPDRDPSIPPEQMYKKAFNKICIHSNVLNFKINEIEVESITAGNKTWATPNYAVFEQGTIKYSNKITVNNQTRDMTSADVSKNNYYVNLILTDTVDDSYKSALISKIKMAVVYQGEPATTPIESITDIYQMRINGNQVVNAEKYIYLEEISTGSYKYVISQYAQSDFYFVFYYQFEDEHIIYDYIPFTISKVAVDDVEVAETAIYLNYEEEENEIYSLANFAHIYPNNTTYKDILYFVPEDANLVEVDSSIKTKIDEEIYVAVGVKDEESDLYDYTKLLAVDTGKTTLIAVVLRIVPEIKENGTIEYKYLVENGNIVWEYYSDPVTVDITKDVVFENDLELDTENSVDLCEEPSSTAEEQEVNLYVEMYQGGKASIKIHYDGKSEYLDSQRLRIVPVLNSDTTVASVDNIDNTTDGVYTFDLLANNIGMIKYQVIYRSSEGESAIYSIGLKVLSIDLVGINLSAENNEIGITFETEGQKVTGYKWNDIEIGLDYKSPKATLNYELRVYELPEDFDESLLSLFENQEYTQEINGLDSSINSIQKFISTLSLSSNYIAVDNVGDAEKDADIIIGELKFGYKFKSLNPNGQTKVLIVAESLNGICSNPLLVNIQIPEIEITYGINNDSNSQSIYVQGELTSIDNIEGQNQKAKTLADSIDLYLSGENTIHITTKINEQEYDISELIHFRFESQTEDGTIKTSTNSGASIEDHLIAFADISKKITEKIVAYTDFGYIKPNFYTYELNPDYKPTNKNSNLIYQTPALLNLFDGIIYVTNYYFDFSLTEAVKGNKLYLPEEFVESVDELTTLYHFDQEFLDLFKYSDTVDDSEAYYHIYCNLSIASATNSGEYSVVNSIKIKLHYGDHSTVYVNLETPADYRLQTIINVRPGILEKFDYNNDTEQSITASLIDNEYQFDLAGKLRFTDAGENYLPNGSSDFEVNLSDIKIAITNSTNEDLLFYKDNDDTNIIGHIKLEEQDYHYQSNSQEGYKQYYIKTKDSSIIEGKDYYEKVNGVFVIVQSPQDAEKQNYYEIVYSNQDYYAFVDSYYVEIDSSLTSEEFVSRYYELDNEGNYVLASVYKSSNQYFYKCKYQHIEEGQDITGAYLQFEITLHVEKDENDNITICKVIVDENIKNLNDSINLIFAIEVRIKNNKTNMSTTSIYDEFFYKLVFVGYEN